MFSVGLILLGSERFTYRGGKRVTKHSNLFSLMWKSENGGQIKKVELTLS